MNIYENFDRTTREKNGIEPKKIILKERFCRGMYNLKLTNDFVPGLSGTK